MLQETSRKEILTNKLINKRQLKDLIYNTFLNYGTVKSSVIADRIKNLTFHYATKSGISLSIEDLRVPSSKRDLIGLTNNEIEIIREKYNIGNITSIERFQKTIDIWNNANSFLKDEVLTYFRESDPLNPLYIMAFSGARGNISQVRQLVGMRGLMSDPQGQIIDLPIRSNFREGLNVTEYIISSYGARKGLVDTALRTADSGYLTRRLVDVAQDIIVRQEDCQTTDGIIISEQNFDPEQLIGRLLVEPLYSETGQLIASRNSELTESLLQSLKGTKYSLLKIRSPLTCNSIRSVCRNCYGWHLAHSKIVDLGEAVGILAAQSIGEPGTQLTMRTFHTGGVFSGDLTDQIRVPFKGEVRYDSDFKAVLFRTIHGSQGFRLQNPLRLYIENTKKTRVAFFLCSGSILLVNDKQKVFKNQTIAEAPKDKALIVEKEQKDIYTEETGELYFQNIEIQESLAESNSTLTTNRKAGLIWVLQGKLYALTHKLSLQPKLGTIVDNDIPLIKENIYNSNEGIVNLNDLYEKQQIHILNFSVLLKNAIGKTEMKNQVLEFQTFKKREFNLKVQSGDVLKQNQIIGVLGDSSYQSKTGGFITYSIDEARNPRRKKNMKKLFSGYFYWVPEETYSLVGLLDNISDTITNGILIPSQTEILPNVFSKTGGVVQIDKTMQELIIKPGELIDITGLDNQMVPKLERFVKPGEFIVPKKIISQRLTFIEFVEIKGYKYILARPVKTQYLEKYSLSKDNPSSMDHTFFPVKSKNYLRIKVIKKFLLKNWEKISSIENVDLLQTFLILDLKDNDNSLIPKVEFIDQLNSSVKCFKIKLSLYETLHLNEAKRLDKNFTNRIRPLVSTNQYVLPNTVLAYTEQFSNQKLLLASTPKTKKSLKQLLILEESHIKKIDYSRFKAEKLKISVGDLIRLGTKISTGIKSPYSGQVLKIENNVILIRVGKPYLVSGGTLIKSFNRHLIKKGDTIATLVYEKLKTTDIVQGLPKVEEILEARKIKNDCLLAPCPGYVFFKARENIIEIYDLNNESRSIPINSNTVVTFSNNSFIDVGEPLTEGIVSPHLKLQVLFDYYKSIYSHNEACRLSFKKLQLFLVGEVQKTYQAQGVQISDKHIEVIVKQMTSKICIENAGYTTFLPGEIVDFRKIEIVDNVATSNNEAPPLYSPILLGITKASLNSDSFISAASFQETTRVLTEAAIEGKKDWLNGLKENVIIGRLIPAGTGFNHEENKEMLKREKYELNLMTRNKLTFIKSRILCSRLSW